MRNLESQLSAFGKHRYDETTKQTRSIINPLRRERSLLWITTPAAALAGIAVGAVEKLETALAKMAAVRKVFSPNAENVGIYKTLYKKYANLYNAIKGL